MPIMADAGSQVRISPVNLAETAEFILGKWCVVPARREVRSGEVRRELEPQVMKVLVALATARPDVLSRDRLVEACWDGRIVGDDTLNRCIVALRHLVNELKPAPFTIETVRGVGYALVETATGTPALRARFRNWPLVAGIAALTIAAAAFLGWNQFRPTNVGPASIAVLPFRNLSPGDPYFAEGISEEILAQLGREPQFRIAGRTSSSQFGAQPDIHEVASRLNVDYILEGSVRRQGQAVRVSAGLVRARDGTQLWADTYDGNLANIFAIQQQIGADIAGSLRRKLARPLEQMPAVANPKAYDLYLAGRALLRTRQRSVGRTASGVLRDAINLDPRYAPAWAALAEATELEGAERGNEALVESRVTSRRIALHALELDPELAKAHLQLGRTAPFGSAEFSSHLIKAAQLDPGDAEGQIWLGVAEGARGRFAEELAAYRRAFHTDPLWFRPTGQLAIALAERGQRAEAISVADRGLATDPINHSILLGRIAWIFGDYSDAARNWTSVIRANSPRWRGPAQRNLDDALFAVGLSGTPGEAAPRAQDMRHRGRVWMTRAPTVAEWKARNRDASAADIYRAENTVSAKLMLQAGRARELAAMYDSPVGLLSVHSGQPLRVDQLREVPVVALALRQVGRAAKAKQLLDQADTLVLAAGNRGPLPFWWDAEAAAIAAVRGETGAALSGLESAQKRGWTHADTTDLRDLADEPAFASLRGNSRFEFLRASLSAQRAREKLEIKRLHL